MPNPQLTGAGLVGLGFLRDTSLHGISSTPPEKRVVGVFPCTTTSKVERKKETNHERSMRDQKSIEIHQMISEIHSENPQ